MPRVQELKSHYFTAWLRRQFDLLIFRDTSTATDPLDAGGEQKDGERTKVYTYKMKEKKAELDSARNALA